MPRPDVLERSVDTLPGVGPAVRRKLGRLGIATIGDLLLHTPRRYLDRSQIFDIAAVPLGEQVTIGGRVTKVEARDLPRKGPRGKPRRMTTATIVDDKGHALKAVWFNPWLKGVEVGRELMLSGEVELFRGTRQMTNPDMEADGPGEPLVTGRVVPVHPEVGKLSCAASCTSSPISQTVWPTTYNPNQPAPAA